MKNTDLPIWNLADLYQGVSDPKIEADLLHALKRAESFEEKYRGQITSGQITPEELSAAIRELEATWEAGDRVISYAQLVFSADTQDSRHGALLQHVRERLSGIHRHLLFFELEWSALSDAKANALMEAKTLEKDVHFLKKTREAAPHRLTEPEENVLEEKANTGIRAFVRLFDETVSDILYPVKSNGQIRLLSQEEAFSLLYHADRPTRQAAAKGLTEGFKRRSSLLTFIFNQVIADHASNDRLRKFPDPMASRNFLNEIKSGEVETLLSNCERYYSLVARYYRLKKKGLKLDLLYDYDRYAPLVPPSEPIPFYTAKEMVLSAFYDFSPKCWEVASLFFKKEWIDAAIRPGKQGGAFSHGTVPSAHPYIFINYLGSLKDVMTLAHELGHGIHQSLAREQNYFNFEPPLTTAEMASVFAEMLVFRHIMNKEDRPTQRLHLLLEKLEESFGTVFRQVALCRFEQAAHTARQKGGELSSDRINTLWMEANKPMFQDSLILTDDYKWWWMYIPHFIHTPFYTYAYAFGHLLVMSLYQKYLQEGEEFVPRYLDLLASGGSLPPEKLLHDKMGMNVKNPRIWLKGLDFLDQMLVEAERLSEK